jgi:hypothetical protein
VYYVCQSFEINGFLTSVTELETCVVAMVGAKVFASQRPARPDAHEVMTVGNKV